MHGARHVAALQTLTPVGVVSDMYSLQRMIAGKWVEEGTTPDPAEYARNRPGDWLDATQERRRIVNLSNGEIQDNSNALTLRKD